MNRVFCVVALLLPGAVYAQNWDLDVAAGFGLTRLIPVNNSTKASAHIRYAFLGPGPYFSPGVSININEHSKFSFGYQYSLNSSGVKFGAGGSSDVEYENFDLHSFYAGYSAYKKAFHERAFIGWLARVALAYGYNTGDGGGSNSGFSPANGGANSYMATQKLTSFEVMPDFWMPCTTIGFTIGPATGNPAIAGRLTFSVMATMGLKNIYSEYSQAKYVVIDQTSAEEGTIRYEGMPLTLQFGLNYRLFRFGHSYD